MGDLTDFLLARIAEDQRASYHNDGETCRACDGIGGPAPGLTDHDEMALSRRRWVADNDAKWKIRSEHLPVGYRNTRTGETDQYCPTCVTPKSPPHSYPCRTIRLLALPYADHPDYREEWKP